ncbi:MAG: shikimate kinase AroK [Halofilum sp. (in: g-proteobacteria)]
MTAGATSTRRVFLVGPMGAGKTTTGRQLARALGLEFVDCDRELEARSGVDIPTIFDFEGEAGFRQRERALVEELTHRDGIVLATGGGVVLDADNRRDLAGRGLVIYLATPVEDQLRRTREDRQRPLLQDGDRHATLARLQDERDPLYREVADIVVDTAGGRRRKIIDRILADLAEHD